jgi:hypothetical protein
MGFHLNYVTVPGDIASFRYYGENRVRVQRMTPVVRFSRLGEEKLHQLKNPFMTNFILKSANPYQSRS